MTHLFPSARMMLGMLMASLVFLLASPLSNHTLWHAQSYAENPQGSPSKDGLEVAGENGAHTRCRDIPEAKGGVLIGYIVPCVIYSIEHTSETFSQHMVDWLMPTVWAFITFVLTMFGIKVMQGEGEVHKEGFLLLLKIGLVVSILQMIPTVAIPKLYDVMKETQMVVSTMIGDSNTEIHCDVDKYGDENTLPIWKQLDCVLGKLYGFTMGTNGHPSMLLVASVFGLMGGFFFGGTFGVALFVALIGMLWSMFSLVLRTAFIFLNSYLYATLILLIAPLFVPLTLLKVTSNYFDKWWGGILASILLPLVATSYVMFAMMVYDKLLFGPKAEINKLFDYSNVREAQRLPRQACNRSVAGNPAQRAQISGMAENIIYHNPFMLNASNLTQSASQDLCSPFQLPVLQIQDIHSTNYQSQKDGFVKLFQNAIKLLVMTLLVNQGFQVILNFSKIITGSFAVGSMLSATSRQEQRFAQGLQSARQGLEAGFNNQSGTGFVSRIPVAVRSSIIGDRETGAQGFIGGITRSTE